MNHQGLTAAIALASTFCCAGVASAQQEITIKNGETLEIARLYSVEKCKSRLVSPPIAEMLLGHPNLSLSLKEAKVRPTDPECKADVQGAIASLVADGITEKSTTDIVVRWTYKLLDGGTSSRGRKIVVTMTP